MMVSNIKLFSLHFEVFYISREIGNTSGLSFITEMTVLLGISLPIVSGSEIHFFFKTRLLLKYFSSWVSIFVVWLKITSSWILCLYQNNFHWVSKLRESVNTLDKWTVELCNRKWNVDINMLIFQFFFCAYINLESEQNQFLNFIIIDQCKSVLFHQIWKFKKHLLKLFYEHVH